MKSRVPRVLVFALVFTCAGANAATNLPFRSSFETGDYTGWHGGDEPTMTVVNSEASDGRWSVRAEMIAGRPTDNYKEYLFGDHARVGGGQPLTRATGLWLSFDSKFDNGFQFGTSASLHKIAIINFEDENGRRRYQILVTVRRSTREYFIENLRWNADRSFAGALPGMPENVGTPVQVRIGQWDRLKLFIRPNTPGSSDGVVRLWVNGMLKGEYTNVAMRENTQYNPNKMIMSNYVSDTTAAGVQRWDNFYLGESDPDGEVRPNPPVLHPPQ